MRLDRIRQLTRRPLLLGLLIILSANAAVGQTKGGQLFGDWVVHCQEEGLEELNCKMSQMAIAEGSAKPLLRVNLRYQPQSGETYIQFVLPLGISLQSPPQLILDQEPAGTLTLDICLPDGCYSTFQLTPAFLENFLNMQTGQIELLAGRGNVRNIPLSGSGARSAYGAMRELAKQLAKRRPKEKRANQ